MSRGYRVSWLTESRTVTATDHCKLEIDLLGILPEGDMLALLREHLGRDGWREKEDGLEITVGNVRAVLTQDGRSVEIRAQREQTATARGTTRAGAAAAAQSEADRTAGQLRERVKQELVRAEPLVRERINRVLQAIYIEALKAKAASLGQVQSVQHNDLGGGEVEVVIKVRA